ncbi:putative protein phosphatase 2C 12 [Platanthera zijinensis]|uniref:protein-serine/threonine phosphatase n=1 Tax=Platanthera zijinensis TaxID=2320716 RepID=A0AAP0BEE7_9ASPA
MGICHSSESAWKQESDESTVYVIGEEELDSDDGGGGGGADEGVAGDNGGGKGVVRRVASLYSRQGKKGPNQDSAILSQGYGAEDGVFCGVFDGHGKNGHMVSRMVRDYLPSLLLSHWNIVADGRDFLAMSPEWSKEWKEVCTNGFKAMDGELLAQLDCSYSGTTAMTIIKQGKDLVIANLGDSRAVLATLCSDGMLKAVQLTTDLTPSLPQEAERIRRSNGRVFALKDEPSVHRIWAPNDNHAGLAMARAFGDFQLKNYGLVALPELSYHRVTNRDFFIVLATDGVWDVLSNEEVVSIVSSAGKGGGGEAAKLVVEAACKAWKRKFPSCRVDDCTAVCIFLHEKAIQKNYCC